MFFPLGFDTGDINIIAFLLYTVLKVGGIYYTIYYIDCNYFNYQFIHKSNRSST